MSIKQTVRAAPTLPSTDELLALGGDERIALDPHTLTNQYCCRPFPDPDRLDIGNGENCFFGQMYADKADENDYCRDGWRYAVETGVIAWHRAYSLGFAVEYDHSSRDAWITNVRSVNAAWRAQIAKLRETVPQPVA